jgi:hypothetical protein
MSIVWDEVACVEWVVKEGCEEGEKDDGDCWF